MVSQANYSGLREPTARATLPRSLSSATKQTQKQPEQNTLGSTYLSQFFASSSPRAVKCVGFTKAEARSGKKTQWPGVGM